MEILISELPSSIEKITAEQYNVTEVNSIAKRYKEVRQRSKAPTFRTYLRWYRIHPSTKLRILT